MLIISDETLTHPPLAVVQHSRHALQFSLIRFLRPTAILNMRKSSIGRTHHGERIARMLGPGRGRLERGVLGKSDALSRAKRDIILFMVGWIGWGLR